MAVLPVPEEIQTTNNTNQNGCTPFVLNEHRDSGQHPEHDFIRVIRAIRG